MDLAWFKKGVRYRCAKHPTNLRSVPGRPGNGTRPLFEPAMDFNGYQSVWGMEATGYPSRFASLTIDA